MNSRVAFRNRLNHFGTKFLDIDVSLRSKCLSAVILMLQFSVLCTQANASVIAEFNMDSDPGWSTDTGWAFGQPTGVAGDPSSGYTGSNVYGNNLNGAYENNITPASYLTSTAIDCSGQSDVHLEFRRFLGVESNFSDDATVEVSNDGTNWTSVWFNPESNMFDYAWCLRRYDVSGIADGQSTVYIRWGLSTNSNGVSIGWNIDDVRVLEYTDVDKDDLNDYEETSIYLTSTSDDDSDNDGYTDGHEVAIGSDPLSDSSVPTAVFFADANFEYIVRSAIGQPTGPIGFLDVQSLGSLYTSSYKDIVDLTGIEFLTGLTYLSVASFSISDISDLSGLTGLTDLSISGSISDISALSGLTGLTSLNLYSNSISDISALSGLTGLTVLSLSSNYISDISALSGLTCKLPLI